MFTFAKRVKALWSLTVNPTCVRCVKNWCACNKLHYGNVLFAVMTSPLYIVTASLIGYLNLTQAVSVDMDGPILSRIWFAYKGTLPIIGECSHPILFLVPERLKSGQWVRRIITLPEEVQLYSTSKYLYVPMHVSPKTPFRAFKTQDDFPLHFSFTFPKLVCSEQSVFLSWPDGLPLAHTVASVRP
jgi:hypothetical protein